MKGASELLLCAVVLTAAWTRTPAGALAQNAVALARGTETVDMLAHFRTELPPRVDAALQRAFARRVAPPIVETTGGWTPALTIAVGAHLGEDALEPLMALSDDPEAALELWSVGPDLRERAITRARAAGESHPGRFSSHRRYLPTQEAREAEEVVEGVLALATVLDLAWPVEADVRVSSGFGYRTHPVLGTKRLHEGVDLATPIGTPVRAAGDGRISRARSDAVNGNHVIINHGHRVTSAYCHADKLHVKTGATVTRGDHILDSGNTGRSTGPHLHFGLRIGGRPVDPAPFQAVAATPAPESEAPPT